MASKTFKQALRSSTLRQLTSTVPPKRTFVTVLSKTRAVKSPASRASGIASTQQIRGIKNIDFAGEKEKVWGKSYPEASYRKLN